MCNNDSPYVPTIPTHSPPLRATREQHARHLLPPALGGILIALGVLMFCGAMAIVAAKMMMFAVFKKFIAFSVVTLF